MPQKDTVKVPSPEIQGEGSYVVLRRLHLKELRGLLARGSVDSIAENLDLSIALLRDNVVAWNWSDAEEQAFPLPKNDPDVFERLTVDEIGWLVQQLVGSPVERKN